VASSLEVSGSASLRGGLSVDRDTSLVGAITQPLTLLTAGAGISGKFDVALLPSVGELGKFFRAVNVPNTRGSGMSTVITVVDLADLVNSAPDDVDDLGFVTPTAAVVGDFDGVNGIDLAIVLPDSTDPVGAAGDLIILYNNGSTGTLWNGWSLGSVQYSVGRNPSGIDVAGIDGPDIDGAPGLDLVITNEADDTVLVLLNNGVIGAGQGFVVGGTFSVGDAPSAVVARDLDDDGFADVATSNSGSSTVSLLRNLGVSGIWQGLGQTLGADRADVSLPTGAAPRDLCAAALDGVPGLEIAVANTGANSVSVIANDSTLRAPWGGGRFTIRPPIPTGTRPVSIEPVNPDEDKWDDLATTNFDSGSVTVILNDTDGSSIQFRPPVDVPVGANPVSLVAIDFDADLDPDLAVVAKDSFGQPVVRIMRNDTQPADPGVTFSFDNDVTSAPRPLRVLAGNVNPAVDLRDDLIVISDQTIPQLAARDAQPAQSQVILSIPCPGDANGDGDVNFADVVSVLSNWTGIGPMGDADRNGLINFGDILHVLALWGAPC